MLSSAVVSILVGSILGFLTGLGTGGGSLLLLWLTLVLGMDPLTARAVNLMFFIPAAITASIIRFRNGGIPVKKIILPALAGCLTAAACTWAGSYMNMEQLKKLFGILLLFTGARELFYGHQRFRKPR